MDLPEDLSLPKVTVQKIIAEIAPPDLPFSKEVRDLIIDCCVEFIQLISTESNDIAEKESKKTIAGEHVIKALTDLGFEEYVEEISGIVLEHKEHQRTKERKQSKLEKSGFSEEELLRQQEELFGKARARFGMQNERPLE